MEESIKIFNECISPLDEQQQAIAKEKHGALIGKLDIETKKAMEDYQVNYTKAEELMLMTIDPKDMKRVLELANNMGFVKAYQDKPNRLRQTITNIIKRIAKCEAMGVPYMKEDNSFESFLFREKLFKNKMKDVDQAYDNKEIEAEEQEMDLHYILGMANELYDACPDITEPKQNVIATVQFEANNNSLSPKEVLLKAFSKYTDASNLNNTIDEVLGFNEEQSGRGR